MHCKNCDEIVNSNYCGNCGQKSTVGAINFSTFINEVSENVFQINKGIFFTLKELFLRPGDCIREFINGKRKKHFKPIGYALTFSTIYFLISRLTNENTWMNDVISGFTNAASEIDEKTKVPVLLIWLSQNFAYATLLSLPIFSFASFICFWGLGRNYLEHMLLNAYITGQQAIFYTIFLLPKIFINDIYVLELIPFVVTVLYTLWVFWQFFKDGNKVLIIIRSIFTYSIYLFLSLGVLFIIMAIQNIG